MRNPWVGLRPFQTADAELFFGRTREAEVLYNLVATLPTLIVYAPSGTGKSSLINAGLAPRLTADPAHVPVFVTDPHDDILTRVREALAATGWRPPPELGLDALLEQHWLATDRRTVLIVDQFEERVNAGAPTEELFAAMAKLVHTHADAACVLLSIREDYLGSLEPLMRRVPSLLNGSYRVPSLSREALMDAVYGPLRTVDRALPVEPDLVGRTLDDLEARSAGRQEPGEQRFEPGYFQIIWSTLWNTRIDAGKARIDLRTYEQLGGASEILKAFTAKILNGMEPAQTSIFWSISRYLVLPTGAKAALTVEDLVDLLQPTDFFSAGRPRRAWLSNLSGHRLAELIRGVLRRLTASDAPILQRVMRLDREEYELLHDLLGRIILEWREEYARSMTEEVESRFAELYAAAREGLPPNRETSDPGAAERSWSTIISQGERDARQLDAQLSQAMTAADMVRMTALVRSVMIFGSRLQSLRRSSEFHFADDTVSREWNAHTASARDKMITIALEDENEIIRRTFQDLITYFDPESGFSSYLTSSPTPRPVFIARSISVFLLAVGSVIASYFVYLPATNHLAVAYVPFTLAHLCLALLLIYSIIMSGPPAASRVVPGREVAQLAVPRLWGGTSNWSLLATWPLPVLAINGIAVATAWGFAAAGWAATAGFNMGMLFGAIAIAIAIAFICDTV